MRLHFLTVPIHDSAAAEAEVNGFLASHRVIAVERHLVPDGGRSAWALCISYTPGDGPASSPSSAPPDPGKRGRVDYREVLAPDEFQRFARLRELRKTLAEREALPPYALFTNDQLAEMARRRVASLAELAAIPGVGQARLDRYGRAFLEALAEARSFLRRERALDLKPDARIAPSAAGLAFLGFRVLRGCLRLSLRRRRRYAAARARWEGAYRRGAIDSAEQRGAPSIDARRLAAGYSAALAITAHAHAAPFRRAELLRRPPVDA